MPFSQRTSLIVPVSSVNEASCFFKAFPLVMMVSCVLLNVIRPQTFTWLLVSPFSIFKTSEISDASSDGWPWFWNANLISCSDSSSSLVLLFIKISSASDIVFLFKVYLEIFTGDEASTFSLNSLCFSGEKHTDLYVFVSGCSFRSKYILFCLLVFIGERLCR